MRWASFFKTVICLAAVQGGVIYAQDSYPRAGWFAELSNLFHDVSGTVVIIDEDSLRVEDFTYDGGGLPGGAYFYLGESDTQSAFDSGLLVGENLFGTSFDGTGDPLFFDLPGGTTLDPYDAISVWCVDARVSFGSGTFVAPEPATFVLMAAAGVTLLDRRGSKGRLA